MSVFRSAIEPDRHGEGYWLVQYGEYDQTSVLAGQPFRQLVCHYQTLEQAMLENPDVEISETIGYVPEPVLSDVPPDWFDPLYAGEEW